MCFRQLLAREDTLSYLFGCRSCHVAVAVDPVLGGEDGFVNEAAKQGVKVTHTHAHADHDSGGLRCAGMSCKPGSTLDFGRCWNSILAQETDNIVTALTGEIPPRPAEMNRMVAFNLGA